MLLVTLRLSVRQILAAILFLSTYAIEGTGSSRRRIGSPGVT
jgi:hypothetical protein